MLIVTEYCREESRKAGTSENQYKAAIALVHEAMYSTRRVDVVDIEVTNHPDYDPWRRLKLKGTPAVSYRAIIEITKTDVIVHVVLPRSSTTYDEVKALWLEHRTA
ncbi:MAG: hypothetical protein WBC91_22135, partial [Phototrophicaceae bacterium]